jgi:hypothetical protein
LSFRLPGHSELQRLPSTRCRRTTAARTEKKTVRD